MPLTVPETDQKFDAPSIPPAVAHLLHELRSPVAIAFSTLETVIESKAVTDPKTLVDISFAQTQMKKTFALVNSSLDFAKLEASKLNLNKNKFDLKELAENIIKAAQILANNNAVKISFELVGSATKIEFDKLRLDQILTNLLSNAVKFTARGHIKLTLILDPKSNTLTCTCEDTGIGMDAEELSRIFTRFSQANSSIAITYGGTGLGLAISKKLVTLMQGDLKAASVGKGHGSTFSFTVPCPVLLVDEKLAATPVLNYSAPRDLTILIADDGQTNRMILDKMFPLCTKAFACDGKQAVDIFQTHETDPSKIKFDLVLMDTAMPVMDGIEATKRICAIRNVPIIGLSANVLDHHKQQAIAAGMSAYQSKPIVKSRLFQAIRALVPNKNNNKQVAVTPVKTATVVTSEDKHATVTGTALPAAFAASPISIAPTALAVVTASPTVLAVPVLAVRAGITMSASPGDTPRPDMTMSREDTQRTNSTNPAPNYNFTCCGYGISFFRLNHPIASVVPASLVAAVPRATPTT